MARRKYHRQIRRLEENLSRYQVLSEAVCKALKIKNEAWIANSADELERIAKLKPEPFAR